MSIPQKSLSNFFFKSTFSVWKVLEKIFYILEKMYDLHKRSLKCCFKKSMFEIALSSENRQKNILKIDFEIFPFLQEILRKMKNPQKTFLKIFSNF